MSLLSECNELFTSFRPSWEAAAVGCFVHRGPIVGPNRPSGRAGRGRSEIRRAADQRGQCCVFWGATQGKISVYDDDNGVFKYALRDVSVLAVGHGKLAKNGMVQVVTLVLFCCVHS